MLFAKPGRRPQAESGWRLSEAEWKKRLTPMQFRVLREAATERPFTSPPNDEHLAGIFLCSGCKLPLYPSKTKYDRGTSRPSFWTTQKHAAVTATARSPGHPTPQIQSPPRGPTRR